MNFKDGKSIRNRVIEHLLTLRNLEFAVGNVAKEIGISRPSAYAILKELERKGMVKKTRIIAGTQLHALNTSKAEVQQLLRDFKECLKRVIDGQAGSSPRASIISDAGMAAVAKNL